MTIISVTHEDRQKAKIMAHEAAAALKMRVTYETWESNGETYTVSLTVEPIYPERN